MKQPGRLREVLGFCGRFLLFAPLCLVAWSLLMPAYAWGLGNACAAILRAFWGIPVERAAVESAGVLNTAMVLSFTLEGRTHPIEVARLITNLAPYVALVLATPRLTWLRRLRILGEGAAILIAGHALYLVITFAYAGAISRAPEVPTALAELFVMLPFLLWIVLAYRGQLLYLLRTGELPPTGVA